MATKTVETPFPLSSIVLVLAHSALDNLKEH